MTPNTNDFLTGHSAAATHPGPWPGAHSQGNENGAQRLQDRRCFLVIQLFQRTAPQVGGFSLPLSEAPSARRGGQASLNPLGVSSHCPPLPKSAILLTFSCTEMGEGGKRAFYNQIISVHSSAIMLMHREAWQMVQSQLCWC